ncbi:uncharacterized protein LOC129913622 [Episyrphus balteatus]|uniref:uncharacterized protein LOC129913622 n=1 Tax=Episyrphus balteatus TaxID=286459 RepID=UPI002484EB69|nr:uncharacterized protein LOC129913622 [Episyrphus balteatus]
MKNLIGIIFGLLLASSASAMPRFDDQLRELVESVRQQLPCGFPTAGIPPLAPYRNQLHQFDLNNRGTDLLGNFTNLIITGIDGFDVKELHYATLLMKLNFDVNFSQIKLFSQYYAKGGVQIFGRNFSLVGNGDFDLLAENIRINGSFHLRPTTSNGLKIWNFKSSFNMDGVKSQTTGILNSPLYSGFFNSWVEEFVRILVDENRDHIGNKIGSYIVPAVNQQLKKVSVLELIGVILGLGAPDSPLFPVCQV